MDILTDKGQQSLRHEDRMIVDDSQICMLQAEKVYGETPMTEVIIEEL